MVAVALATEDALSEAVGLRLIAEAGNGIEVVQTLRKRGKIFPEIQTRFRMQSDFYSNWLKARRERFVKNWWPNPARSHRKASDITRSWVSLLEPGGIHDRRRAAPIALRVQDGA